MTTSAPSANPKVGFISLGCPKNLVDTEVMMGELSERGHELTSEPGDADAQEVLHGCEPMGEAARSRLLPQFRGPINKAR